MVPIRKVLFALIIGMLLLTVSLPLSAVSKKQVLIIDIPRLTFEDLSESPNLVGFLTTAAVGVMTVPVVGPVTPEKVYFGFNSGTQLNLPVEDGLVMLNAGEEYKKLPAGVLYHSLTGFKVAEAGGAYLNLAKVVQLNPGSAPNIGRFGRLLRQHSLKTAAIGNADADVLNRSGAILLMDEKGQIDMAALGKETLRHDPEFPYGMVTDTENLLFQWRAFREKADVIVLTLGDLERLERFGSFLSDERWNYYRQEIMKRYDLFFKRLLPTVDFDSTLTLVFTAVPPQRKSEMGERLALTALKGPGFQPGLLFSHSTRKAMVIVEYDLPATILKFLGVNESSRFNGQGLESVPGNWEKAALCRMQLEKNYNLRWPLLTGYVYLLIGSVLAGIAGLVFHWRPICLKVLSYIYSALMMIPLVFLIEALFNPLDWFGIILSTLSLVGLFLILAVRTCGANPFRIISAISIFTVILIIGDGLGNGFLEVKSFLGYSMVAGARFYGIGNEYLGFLLGAYIVLMSLNLKFVKPYRSLLLWLGTCLIAIVVAHPNFGANIGGGITAMLGLGITNYLLLGEQVHLKQIGRLLFFVLALLTVIGLWDFFISRSSMTHFGQLLILMKDEGFPVVKEMIVRKWELNIQLMNYTPWSKVLVGILIVAPLMYYKPSGAVLKLLWIYPDELRGFLGLIFTAFAALMVNDSGIVAVATMFIFGVSLLLLVLFEEWGSKGAMNDERRYN